MNVIDRLLQRWRINKVRPYLAKGASVLDVGCADGALFRHVTGLGRCVGIDPYLDCTSPLREATLIKGQFPQALGDCEPFDAIVLLAVLEHVPPAQREVLGRNCARYLKPGGYVLVTVPSSAADAILALLRFLRIIHGMSLEEHQGFDARQTPATFEPAGLSLVKRRRFQFGLNNFFVFQKPPA